MFCTCAVLGTDFYQILSLNTNTPASPQLIILISPHPVQLYTAAIDLVETDLLSSLLPRQHMKPLIAWLQPTCQAVCPVLLLSVAHASHFFVFALAIPPAWDALPLYFRPANLHSSFRQLFRGSSDTGLLTQQPVSLASSVPPCARSRLH